MMRANDAKPLLPVSHLESVSYASPPASPRCWASQRRARRPGWVACLLAAVLLIAAAGLTATLVVGRGGTNYWSLSGGAESSESAEVLVDAGAATGLPLTGWPPSDTAAAADRAPSDAVSAEERTAEAQDGFERQDADAADAAADAGDGAPPTDTADGAGTTGIAEVMDVAEIEAVREQVAAALHDGSATSAGAEPDIVDADAAVSGATGEGFDEGHGMPEMEVETRDALRYDEAGAEAGGAEVGGGAQAVAGDGSGGEYRSVYDAAQDAAYDAAQQYDAVQQYGVADSEAAAEAELQQYGDAAEQYGDPAQRYDAAEPEAQLDVARQYAYEDAAEGGGGAVYYGGSGGADVGSVGQGAGGGAEEGEGGYWASQQGGGDVSAEEAALDYDTAAQPGEERAMVGEYGGRPAEQSAAEYGLEPAGLPGSEEEARPEYGWQG